MKRIINRIRTFLLIGVFGVILTSCNKQYQDDPTPPTEQNKEVTVSLGLTTDIKDSPMTKSFDPSVWVYQYCTYTI